MSKRIQAPWTGDTSVGALARLAGVRVVYRRVPMAGWSAERPLRIVMIADLHAGGPQMPMRRVDAIVACANALGGDLIALLGDYLADHKFMTERVSIEEVAEAFTHLAAPMGRMAVLGNHDWYADREAQARKQGPVRAQQVLAASGIDVMENEARLLEGAGGPVWIAGLGAQVTRRRRDKRYGDWCGVDDLGATLDAITSDDPAVLLAHEPDIFAEVPKRVSVTLSGHTHGGQINLFGWRPATPSRFGARYAYGHIEEEGRHLVVSGGLGCSGLPIRFLCPPEVTVVDLGPVG